MNRSRTQSRKALKLHAQVYFGSVGRPLQPDRRCVFDSQKKYGTSILVTESFVLLFLVTWLLLRSVSSADAEMKLRLLARLAQ